MINLQSSISQSFLNCASSNAEAMLNPSFLQASLASKYNEAMIVFAMIEV